MNFMETLSRHNSAHPGTQVEMRAKDDHCLELALSGELDMKASRDLTPLLELAVLECPKNGRLVLSLSRVNYIASTGVGLLASTLALAEGRSVSLILLDIPPKIRNIMDTLGLMSFFTEEKSSCA